MADADAEAEVVVFAVAVARLDAVCDALLAVWLLLVEDVQPAIANDAAITTTMTANNFFIMYIAATKKLCQTFKKDYWSQLGCLQPRGGQETMKDAFLAAAVCVLIFGSLAGITAVLTTVF
ncbi:MAG: hypothetical protein ACXV2D_07070 [Halobacteriota archaeon]